MCNCINQANKALAEKNTVLATTLQVNLKTGKVTPVITVPTKKMNSRGPKAAIVPINYCPLCGVKAA